MTNADKKSGYQVTPLAQKLILTVIVGLFLIWHLYADGGKRFDSIALALLFIATLPWLASILEIAELPGGIKFKFINDIKVEQERQARELKWIIELLTNLVTSEYERTHLRHFAEESAFEADIKEGGSPFESELRHLRSLGLIELISPEKTISKLFSKGGKQNVKEYLRISGLGQKYLDVLERVKSLG
jgi:hypothetical protein